MAVTFTGSVKTPIVLGNAETSQTIFTCENLAQSRVNLYIRRFSLQMDAIVVYTAVMPIVRVSRASSISGGVILEKSNFNTTQTSSSSVVFRTQAGESGKITATPGDTIWQQYANRMHTAVEQQQGTDQNLLPMLIDTKDFILRPGQCLAVTVVGSAAAANPLTNNWIIEAVFEEQSINTFAISGQVTLSAVGVSGAKVMVLEGDDESMTNARLVEVVTTDGSGNWASTIRTGCVGAALVQYKSGATYYNAPGSPYLQ